MVVGMLGRNTDADLSTLNEFYNLILMFDTDTSGLGNPNYKKLRDHM